MFELIANSLPQPGRASHPAQFVANGVNGFDGFFRESEEDGPIFVFFMYVPQIVGFAAIRHFRAGLQMAARCI